MARIFAKTQWFWQYARKGSRFYLLPPPFRPTTIGTILPTPTVNCSRHCTLGVRLGVCNAGRQDALSAAQFPEIVWRGAERTFAYLDQILHVILSCSKTIRTSVHVVSHFLLASLWCPVRAWCNGPWIHGRTRVHQSPPASLRSPCVKCGRRQGSHTWPLSWYIDFDGTRCRTVQPREPTFLLLWCREIGSPMRCSTTYPIAPLNLCSAQGPTGEIPWSLEIWLPWT